MLMANSVEGRFPFLDVHVAEFAARLPERLRLRDLQEKYLLRKAVAPLLPDAVARRPKRPYRALSCARSSAAGAAIRQGAAFARARGCRRPVRGRGGGAAGGQVRALPDTGLSESDEMGLVGVL